MKKSRFSEAQILGILKEVEMGASPRTLDAALAMVTVGMAWWYRAYAREQSPQERGQYEFAEKGAKARKAGLWRDPEPVAPWDWRKGPR